jgi:hypothetical protein
MAGVRSEDLPSIGEALMYSNLGLTEYIGHGDHRTEALGFLGYHWVGDPSLYAGPNPDPGGEPPPADNGESCSADDACSSGHCVDGVYCDSACSGACMVCDEPDNLGRCIYNPELDPLCKDNDPCFIGQF